AAAAGDRPAGGAAVLRRPPRPGAAAGPAVAVQRLRVAVVRRHLPAAVRLARAVRDPAHVPPGRLGAAAAAPGACQPVPPAARGPSRDPARPGRGARGRGGGADGPAVPAADGRRLVRRGTGLTARGRE